MLSVYNICFSVKPGFHLVLTVVNIKAQSTIQRAHFMFLPLILA